MHLSEGVLHVPTLLGGAVLALVGVALGLRKLHDDKLPLTALFAAAFFVASSLHIPVGIGSVHLVLNGLAGLFLGWAVFPAFLVALLLQALLFSFGGVSVLGVNLCIMALPALFVHYAFRPFLSATLSPVKQLFIGMGAGSLGVGGAAALASVVLSFDGGKSYLDLISLLLISHLPVFVVDSLVSTGILLALTKMQPSLLERPS